MEYKISRQSRGTRIIVGDEAKQRRELLNQMIAIVEDAGFQEIILPSIEPADIYTDKAGDEVLGQMYVFPDKKGRELCLRPEGTATIQLLADERFKNQNDVKLWYFEKCWRYERPQKGRYREFYQFGVEWLNPSSDIQLTGLACSLVELATDNYDLNILAKRGLNYYLGNGFEISIDSLGAQKQVVGGGWYKQGVGFAIGFDRLMICKGER